MGICCWEWFDFWRRSLKSSFSMGFRSCIRQFLGAISMLFRPSAWGAAATGYRSSSSRKQEEKVATSIFFYGFQKSRRSSSSRRKQEEKVAKIIFFYGFQTLH